MHRSAGEMGKSSGMLVLWLCVLHLDGKEKGGGGVNCSAAQQKEKNTFQRVTSLVHHYEEHLLGWCHITCCERLEKKRSRPWVQTPLVGCDRSNPPPLQDVLFHLHMTLSNISSLFFSII